MNTKRALLTGHFSTVGDIESLTVVQSWLRDLGIAYDIAPFAESVRAAMPGACDLARVDPSRYDCLIMICGPVWREQLEQVGFDFARFQHCARIGVNLTMVAPAREWNPFDLLLERDSDRRARPDLTFFADTPQVPVVGRCLVHRQSSYAGRERHDQAQLAFEALSRRHNFAVVDLDTRWYRAKNSLKTPSHFLSALQRVDLLLTNRLHGMVYAIKAGVPVIAIDAIAGGAKVSAQAQVIGWPQCIPIEEATVERLDTAVGWCLSPLGRAAAKACRRRAGDALHDVKRQLMAALT